MFNRLFSEKIFLIFLVIVSVVLNLFLTLELRGLKSALAQIKSEELESKLILGQTVGPLEVGDVQGQAVRINYNDFQEPTIVYVFSPDCIWCDRNLQNIRHLHEHAKTRYNFVAVSIQKESSQAASEKQDLPFPVYFEPSDTNRREFNFRSTPATYLISKEGKILKFWSGAYGNKTLEDLEAFFHFFS